MVRRSTTRSAVALIALAVACKGVVGESHEDPGNGSGDTRNWAFSMSVSPPNGFTVTQGSVDTLIVTMTRTGGFTGAIALQAFVPGPGYTVVFENITSTGTVTTARAIMTVSGSFPVGSNFEFGIAGQPASQEVEPKNVLVNFNVIRKNGTFTNAPATLSVGQGQSVGARISIIRTNFTAPVPMNIIGAPAGMTAIFSPNPIADTVTQMTLSAAASVPEGTYNIGVRANEGTQFQGTAPVAVTVTAPVSIGISFATNPLAIVGTTPVGTQINITRSNYTGVLNFIAQPIPNLTFTYAPQGAAGATSHLLTITASPSIVAGTYTTMFTVSGANNSPLTTGTLTLNVSK